MLETAGWETLDAASKSAFETILEELKRTGIQLLRRSVDPMVDKLERAIANAGPLCNAITAWENRWSQRSLVDQNPDGVSARTKATLANAEAMTVVDYRAALIDRETAQLCFARVAPRADAVITLSCPGPAPLWSGDEPGKPLAPRPTGDPVFNFPSSMLFAPAVTMPIMSVQGMPVGVQLMGQQHEDARITAMARWMLEAVSPVIVA